MTNEQKDIARFFSMIKKVNKDVTVLPTSIRHDIEKEFIHGESLSVEEISYIRLEGISIFASESPVWQRALLSGYTMVAGVEITKLGYVLVTLWQNDDKEKPMFAGLACCKESEIKPGKERPVDPASCKKSLPNDAQQGMKDHLPLYEAVQKFNEAVFELNRDCQGFPNDWKLAKAVQPAYKVIGYPILPGDLVLDSCCEVLEGIEVTRLGCRLASIWRDGKFMGIGYYSTKEVASERSYSDLDIKGDPTGVTMSDGGPELCEYEKLRIEEMDAPEFTIVNTIVASLNYAFARDPDAIQSLMMARFDCNKQLADHAFFPVDHVSDHGGNFDRFQISAIGLLNCALNVMGGDRIAVKLDGGKFSGFMLYVPPAPATKCEGADPVKEAAPPTKEKSIREQLLDAAAKPYPGQDQEFVDACVKLAKASSLPRIIAAHHYDGTKMTEAELKALEPVLEMGREAIKG